MVQISYTSDDSHQHLKALVYGQSGVGKTTLIKTLDNPIIIDAESGTLSLRDVKVPKITVRTFAEVQEAYRLVTESEEGKSFNWICLDSLTEIAEVVLANEKKAHKDPRKAYGELYERMRDLIRAFRNLPRNVYMSATVERIDDGGVQLWGPSMPGAKLGQKLAHDFDLVCAYRVKQTDEGIVRALQTDSDGAWVAKDRSGVLDLYEEPNLQNIYNKIMN